MLNMCRERSLKRSTERASDRSRWYSGARMQAHRVKVVVTEDHQITVKLPSDFPPGEAELIVLAQGASRSHAEPFHTWLDALLRRLPPTPTVPLEALRRENLYEDD